jgi:hypothetical protein
MNGRPGSATQPVHSIARLGAPPKGYGLALRGYKAEEGIISFLVSAA